MVHSSASDSSRRNSSEISWYYIQPGFKLIDAKKCAWAFAFFVFILFVISRFSHSLIFDSPWALLIVPGVAAFVIWLMLVMQPHRQVYYRLDQDGVFCEYRSSASALTSFLDLILSLLGSIIKLKNTFYINKHSSRSRMFEWGEVVAVHEAPYWKKITLQAGLHGELNLWTNAENYGNVLTLVREYVAKERKNYVRKWQVRSSASSDIKISVISEAMKPLPKLLNDHL